MFEGAHAIVTLGMVLLIIVVPAVLYKGFVIMGKEVKQ